MNINFITIAAILIFFIGSVQVYAQKDTVFTKISTEYGTLEQQEIETEADRLFGIHVPSKWAIKFARNFRTPNNTDINTPYDIGIEYKIRPSISVGISYYLDKKDNYLYQSLQIEERWYYKMAKRNAQGKGANNMTGSYLGLQQSIFIGHSTSPNLRDVNNYKLRLNYGIQNRFKKYGFFDFSAGLGMLYQPYGGILNSSYWGLTFDQTFRIGLGIFENNREANFSGSYCNVLRCFDEDKQMWKINGLGAAQLGYGVLTSYSRFTRFSITPNIAFEQKLGNKPFSVEVSNNLTLTGIRNIGIGTNDFSINNNFSKILSNLTSIEFRWYYDQLRRIANGNSGNNLSGPFIALNTGYRFESRPIRTFDGLRQKSFHQVSHNLLLGYQLRIFKHGYAQFRIGSGINGSYFEEQQEIWNWIADLKVGYAF